MRLVHPGAEIRCGQRRRLTISLLLGHVRVVHERGLGWACVGLTANRAAWQACASAFEAGEGQYAS